MSTPNPSPSSSLNLEQQRTRAKELLAAARAGDAAALARLRAARSDAGTTARPLMLADAQLATAREAGFASWPALVAGLAHQDVEAFKDAVQADDVSAAGRLLQRAHVREHVNDPLFAFGQRAAHVAAKSQGMLEALLAAGADVTLKSDWANGPYTVLDNADAPTARFLIASGAALTPNVAARLGWIEELAALLDADPGLVHARGGDGQQPLHEAQTVAIADLLLDRGAEIDARCIDHKSTAAQYALVDRPEVCRQLLARGAEPDIFMAARLGDAALAGRLLDATPDAVGARVNEPGYGPVPPFNIYCWTLGFGVTPHEVAARFEQSGVLALLSARSTPRVRLMAAIARADEAGARAIIAADPSALANLTVHDHGQLALAVFHERFDAANLMLRLGFDPAAPGVDGGTALHAACWVGSVRLVAQVLARGGVAVDARDPTHKSTPLGWAAFGSVHRRAPGSDYPAVAAMLVDAGADIAAVANGEGRSLVSMAKGNPSMQDALRRLGAA